MSNLLEQSSKNRVHIDDFIDSLGPLSKSRRKKYRVTLGKVSRELGEFTDVDKTKLKEYIVEKNELSISDHTKRDYRLVLKKFFGWSCQISETRRTEWWWVKSNAKQSCSEELQLIDLGY